MNRFMIAGLAGLACGLVSAFAAQDTAIDNVEVRDPIRLEAYLEANASDAQSRLAALEVSLGTNTTTLVTVGALTTTGAVTIAEGALANSTIVSADIKDGTIAAADLDNAAAFTFGSVTTTGAVGIAEGQLTDSTIVSADIKNGVIVSADLANATAFSLGAVAVTGMTTTVGFTLATKVCSLITLTNVVHGGTTADVNVVTWAP